MARRRSAVKQVRSRRASQLAVCFAAVFIALGLSLAAPAAPTTSGTHIPAITYTSNATWTLAGSPFVIDGNVTVASGATLTIEPGVVVKLNGSLRSITVDGTLTAVGTPAEHITFTSIQDDATGGDAGGDGPSSGEPGQWLNIAVRAGSASQLVYSDVRFGGWGSADWGYGAVEVTGTSTQLAVSHSDITDNQRSGLKVGPGATLNLVDSTSSRNAIGISVNMGTVAAANRTSITDNLTDGVWFNFTNSFQGTSSSIMNSDVIGNGRYGVYVQIPRDLPVTRWPHGNGNNIYDNVVKQLYLAGYHPSSTPYYDVDWTGNHWGVTTYYWQAPGACAGVSPNSSGHLASQGSPSNPPSGPVSSGVYFAGSQSCAYDRFRISPTGFVAVYTPADPSLTPEQHATVVAIAENDPRVIELVAGRSYATSVDEWSMINTDQVLGANVTFSWTDAVTLEDDWPSIAYDESETSFPPYDEGVTHFAAEHVKTLDVLVDLTQGRVVSIEPGVEADISENPELYARAGPTRALDSPPAENMNGRPTGKLRIICIADDCFRNYDFSPRGRTAGVNSRRVDWPISMLYWGNADVDKVKYGLSFVDYTHTIGASPQYGRVNDGAGWVWDSDEGVKTSACPVLGKAYHTRMYADGDDQLYNLELGFYVIASTHIDNRECAPSGRGKWHGKSEVVEDDLATRVVAAASPPFSYLPGWTVAEDALQLYNFERGPDRGRYRTWNNGLATKVYIP